jgi:hypothetical protein
MNRRASIRHGSSPRAELRAALELECLHRRPWLLAKLIRLAAIPIQLRTGCGMVRRLQQVGAARFGLIDRRAQIACSMLRCRRTDARNAARGS